MPSPFERLISSMRDSMQRLDGPQYQAERQQDDLNPANLYNIDREMMRAGPDQRDVLAQERRRLEQVQTQQMMKAAQTFQPRMAQMLQLPQMGPMDYAKTMMQSFQGQQQQRPNLPINGQPVSVPPGQRPTMHLDVGRFPPRG